MVNKATILAGAAALVPVPALAETVLGVTVFSRHGDRTSKYYDGAYLTNVGKQQVFQVGSDYRERYLLSSSSKQIMGISQDQYVADQVYASAPDSDVLLDTATAFLQGLYPPLEQLDSSLSSQELTNGSESTAPLGGYQYVVVHGEDDNSPDTIWIKGDAGCPALTAASATYNESQQYTSLEASTADFYTGFWDDLSSVSGLSQDDLSYTNAYEIFDLLNTASIHNVSAPPNITSNQLFQLRTLADASELAAVYNASQPDRSIGAQTLSAAILAQLNETVTGKGALKFSLMAGSYDTFQAFFGISGLLPVNQPNFYGLPDYASTMAFELFTEADGVTSFPESTDDLKVRFLFRNGSAVATESDMSDQLQAFPLFGSGQDSLSWDSFFSGMQNLAISTVEDWCSVCGSTEDYCPTDDDSETVSPASSSSDNGITKAVAGVIGAMVTLAVVGLCGLVFFLVRRSKASKANRGMAVQGEGAVAGTVGHNEKAGSLSS